MSGSDKPNRRFTLQRAATVAGAFVVAAFAGWWAARLLGPAPMDPRNLQWVWGDLAQVYVAWSQYLSDPNVSWLGSTRLSYPLPLSISLFDPMPVLLLLARPFSGLVTPGSQYFGYYFVACLVLQGVFGYLAALRTLRLVDAGQGLGSRYVAVLVGILFATIPYTFYRFQGHTALSSQWVLVLSVWVALTSLDWTRWRWCLVNASVVLLATGLNPYLALLVMLSTGGLTLATRRTLRAREVAVRLVALALAGGFGLWMFGFMGGSTAHSGGYGIYSMNLLGPFDSNGIARLLPLDVPDPTGGQVFEGYTYVGLGLLLLAAVTVLSCINHRLRPSGFPFAGGILVAVLCTLLALSAVVTLAGYAVEIPLPKGIIYLLSRFRGSGRLFWMAGFWMILICLAACTLRFGLARTALLLSALVIVQLLDIRPIASKVHATIASAQSLHFSDIPQANYSAVLVFPAWQCDNASTPGGPRNYESVGYLAAGSRMSTNNFYAARTPDDQRAYHCDYEARLARIDRQAIYLLSGPLMEQFRPAFAHSHVCSSLANFDGAWKCLPKQRP